MKEVYFEDFEQFKEDYNLSDLDLDWCIDRIHDEQLVFSTKLIQEEDIPILDFDCFYFKLDDIVYIKLFDGEIIADFVDRAYLYIITYPISTEMFKELEL